MPVMGSVTGNKCLDLKGLRARNRLGRSDAGLAQLVVHLICKSCIEWGARLDACDSKC